MDDVGNNFHINNFDYLTTKKANNNRQRNREANFFVLYNIIQSEYE